MNANESSAPRSLIVWVWLLPLALFGYLSLIAPWPVADAALRHLGDGPKIVVAMSYQAGDNYSIRRQVYLVFPDAVRSLRAHEVIEKNDAVRVESMAYGFVVSVAVYGIWIALSVWAVLRRRRHRGGDRIGRAEARPD